MLEILEALGLVIMVRYAALNIEKISLVFEKVKGAVKSELVDNGESAALEFCLEQIFLPIKDNYEEIAKFQYILEALSLITTDQTFSQSEIQKLVSLGRTILIKNNLKVSSARYSGLHSNLYLALSRVQASRGDSTSALWNLALADQTTSKEDYKTVMNIMLGQADSFYLLGHIRSASEIYMVAESSDYSDDKEKIALKALHSLRVSGRDREYYRLYQKIVNGNLSELARLEVDFEYMLYQCKKEDNAKSLALCLKNGKQYSEWPWFPKVVLWLYCSDQRNLIKNIPKVTTLRKKIPKEVPLQEYSNILKVLVLLQEAYDQDLPIFIRLSKLEKIVSIYQNLGSPEYQLLVLGSMCKWVCRFHQKQFLGFLLVEYKTLSQRVTERISDDILGILKSLGQERGIEVYWLERLLRVTEPKEHRMITSQSQRNLLIAKLSGKVFLSVARNKIGKYFLGRDLEAASYEDVFLSVIHTFGHLKGPALKIGQQIYLNQKLSSEISALIPQMYANIPAINFEEIRGILERELGGDLHNLFRFIDEQPISSASIGQVHKGELLDGKLVAIKVQYPEISNIIKADLKTLRMILLPIVNSFFKDYDLGIILDELEEKLLAETNYVREAKCQKRFSDLFTEDEDIVIPEIHHTLCTDKVVVMDYHEGLNILDFSRSATEKEKVNALRTMLKMFGKSYFSGHIFQGDTHPDNFLLDGNRVVFLDFGFTIEKLPHKVALWHSVLTHVQKRDFESVKIDLFNYYGKGQESIESFVDAISTKYKIIWDYLSEGPQKVTSEHIDAYNRLAFEVTTNPEWHKIFQLWSSSDLIGLRNLASYSYIHSLFDVEFDMDQILVENLKFYKAN